MWTYTHSLETTASPDAVFALFKDVDTWPEWNAGLERMVLDGPFATGTNSTMFVAGQDPLVARLVWVKEGRGFEDETPIPDAGVVVRVRHCLEPLSDGGALITYAATLDGPAADTLGPTLGAAITADFPDVMAALAARAVATTALA
jgi:Polyketide cyclase / dehydrase and lipid transport